MLLSHYWTMCSLMLMAFSSQTALLHAANHNHHLIVADLICLGANVNETNNSGKSCLHLSAEKGYIRVLEVRALFSTLLLKMCLGQGLCCLSLHLAHGISDETSVVPIQKVLVHLINHHLISISLLFQLL